MRRHATFASCRIAFLCAAATMSAASPAFAQPAEADFQSPSGNIVCSIHSGLTNYDAAGVACDIDRHDYGTPAEAVGCEHGGGLRFIVAGGNPATVSCHHDTLRVADARVLDYQDTLTLATIGCRSSEGFVACSDDSTGHGFVISRQSYHLN